MTDVRLNVNIPQDAATALRDSSDRSGVTMTEALRRSIAVSHLLVSEQRDGGRIITEDARGRHQKEVVIL